MTENDHELRAVSAEAQAPLKHVLKDENPDQSPMKDWPSHLYLENAQTYLPVLEQGLRSAPAEVKSLVKLFRTHGVSRGSRVLDLSCGIGRHSTLLAEKGYEVVGYDPSPTFLKYARKLAASRGIPKERVRFYQGDLAQTAESLTARDEAKFDAILSMDYSFGYSGVNNDLKLFRALHRLGSANSLLLLETGNRDFWDKHNPPFYVERFPRHLERISRFHYDRRRKMLFCDWEFFRRTRKRDLHHLLSTKTSTHIYSRDELIQVLARAHWDYVNCYGRTAGLQDFSPDWYYMLMVARKGKLASMAS